MEYATQILQHRQHLRDLLNTALKDSPITLFLIRDIKAEIEFCNTVLAAIKVNSKIS